MATKRQNMAAVPDVQYLVKCSGEEDFVIEIPADWKVTFGRVNPALEGERGYGNNGHCVRVWEGEKLRAVFGNATGLRDLSIPLARKVTKVETEHEYKGDSLGNFNLKETRKVLDSGFKVQDEEQLKF